MAAKKTNKPDKSVRVNQRESIKFDLNIYEFPWTEKQKKFIETALNKDTKVVICRAPAGVGKTLMALYCSLTKLKENKIKEIVYLRLPLESSSKSIGYLKGDFDEKMSVYGLPLMDHMKELLSESEMNKIINDNRVQVDSIGFCKGRTWNVSSIIADEVEDLTLPEFSLLMTRLGKYSMLFLIGDSNQSNIKNSGFDKVFNLFNNEESKLAGIHTFEFDSSDCMRSPITKFILEKFESIK